MTGRSSDSGAYAANTEGRTSTKHPAPASTAYVSPGAPLSDSSLIARIFQRDEQALGFLYDRYDRLVYTIALRITNDRAAAEEVVRDVFQGVWQSAGSFQPGGSVSAWLIGSARHRAIDFLSLLHGALVCNGACFWLSFCAPCGAVLCGHFNSRSHVGFSASRLSGN